MAKKNGSIMYKCSNCGYSQPRWLGRCPDCGQWNSLEEIIIDKTKTGPAGRTSEEQVKVKPVSLSSVDASDTTRISTGIEEFDRVLGSGATKRSAILLGGEPGIGKSTLLLQTASGISNKLAADKQILYVSGEESAAQIKDRAIRLGIDSSRIQLLCTSRLEDTLDALDSINPLDTLDSLHRAIYLRNKALDDSIAADSANRKRKNGIDFPVPAT